MSPDWINYYYCFIFFFENDCNKNKWTFCNIHVYLSLIHICFPFDERMVKLKRKRSSTSIDWEPNTWQNGKYTTHTYKHTRSKIFYYKFWHIFHTHSHLNASQANPSHSVCIVSVSAEIWWICDSIVSGRKKMRHANIRSHTERGKQERERETYNEKW